MTSTTCSGKVGGGTESEKEGGGKGYEIKEGGGGEGKHMVVVASVLL